MITITRRQARRLRAVFRRHPLGIAHKGQVPPLVFRADPDAGLRVRHHQGPLAVEHVLQGTHLPGGPIALPLDALADFEGRDDTPVILEAVATDRTVVRWEDRASEYAVTPLDALAPFPEVPDSWSEAPAGLLDALAEATATAAEETTRYALDCIQLRGASGAVVATDGCQLLVAGGFPFPWTDDVLVRRSPLFANKELPRDRPIQIGKTDTHVVIRVGPWSLSLEIQARARYPRIDEAIPDAAATSTRLRLDPGDAAFLTDALDRLPGAGEENGPATLDLNGKVALRSRDPDQAGATELILSRSGYTGTPVRLNTNREFLARAVRLGFSEVEIVDAESPIVCHSGLRVFAWQPLSHESAIEPTDDVARIVSDHSTTPTAIRPEGPTESRTSMSERTDQTKDDAGSNGPSTGHAAIPANTEPGSLAALIQEAEALHDVLADARARSGRLTVALRRYRRRERLVSNTLASLKALKLQDVAG